MSDTNDVISFKLPMKPKPKQRPQFSRNGHAYTPAATRQYEDAVRRVAIDTMDGRPPLSGEVSVYIELKDDGAWVMVQPTNRKRGKLRGDLDNYGKAIRDALQGVVYNNDRQITSSVESFMP